MGQVLRLVRPVSEYCDWVGYMSSITPCISVLGTEINTLVTLPVCHDLVAILTTCLT